MKLVIVVLASVLVAWLYAPAALAQDGDQVVAPPGNSGVEEYLEIVPGAGGDRPASPTDKPSQGSGGSTDAASVSPSPSEVLGAKTARELDRLGADGRAAAAVAAAGAPSVARTDGATKQQKSQKASAPEAAPLDADAGGRAEAVAGALAGSGGGMGLAFPLVLLVAFAAALGMLAIRRSARRG